MTRYLAICGTAFAAGAALAVGLVRAWDWFNSSLDNALRWGSE